MTELKTNIPVGVGDLIYVRGILDAVKHKYQKIYVTPHRHLIEAFKYGSVEYNDFVTALGKLLFGDGPYIFDNGKFDFRSQQQLVSDFEITPRKPELASCLCQGQPLNIGDYIVISTKVRYLDRQTYEIIKSNLWQAVNKVLTDRRYKLVVLGEKVVEMNPEYQHYTDRYIYSIYPDIISQVGSDKLVDLTFPALGITSPNLKQLLQDCLIMNQAKFVITLGVGGNFCMATAVANTIGYRLDNDEIADLMFKTELPTAFITKEFDRFINRIKG